MEAEHRQQNMYLKNGWDILKGIFWGMAICSVIINALNVITGTDSLGVYIFVFSLVGLAGAFFLVFLKNKQNNKMDNS